MKLVYLCWFLGCALTLGTMTAAESAASGAAAEAVWIDDYAAARRQAAAEQKPLLLNFTGSDWCVWCHRLRDEVFLQPAFQAFARTELVLVEVDFPHAKPQSEEQKEQNAELGKTYQIAEYPTVVLTDAQGRELGRVGYMLGGAKTFVRELKRLLAAAKAGTAKD